MGRQTDDGRHEGYVAHLFADGMYGGTWSNGPVATSTADGALLDSKQWQYRTQDEVVGWRVICTDMRNYKAPECWRGPVWTRVATAAEADPERHRVYAPDPYGLDEDTSDLIMLDWERHIAPSQAAYPVELAAREFYDAQDRLNEAVRQARADGASWTDIGDAAGMSRQSAHQRWSKVVD